MKPSIRLEHALIAVESEHDVNVMLELAAPAPDAAKARPPIAVALVLDRSGSMAGAPLDTAKRAASGYAAGSARTTASPWSRSTTTSVFPRRPRPARR